MGRKPYSKSTELASKGFFSPRLANKCQQRYLSPHEANSLNSRSPQGLLAQRRFSAPSRLVGAQKSLPSPDAHPSPQNPSKRASCHVAGPTFGADTRRTAHPWSRSCASRGLADRAAETPTAPHLWTSSEQASEGGGLDKINCLGPMKRTCSDLAN